MSCNNENWHSYNLPKEDSRNTNIDQHQEIQMKKYRYKLYFNRYF